MAEGPLKRLIMRHYRRFAPALDLGAEAFGRLARGYEGFDAENAVLMGELGEELGKVLGARSTLDHWRAGKAFEAELAAWCGRRRAVGLGSGTAALALTMVAMGIGPGDEVITSAHSFIATALAVHQTGARLVLVDPDPSDLCLRAAAVEAALSPRTRLILPVHMHGHLAEMDAILTLARARGLRVLEDCAQAAGAREGGRRAPIGGTGCLSFYPSKPLGGLGNGGALITDDDALADAVERLRDPDAADPLLLRGARTPSFLHPVDVALLRLRLPRQEARQAARAERAARYATRLGHLRPLRPRPGVDSAWGAYTIRHPRRDALKARLMAAGFETRVEYPTPFFDSPTLAALGPFGPLPVAREAAAQGLSLPTRPTYPLADVDALCDAILRFG